MSRKTSFALGAALLIFLLSSLFVQVCALPAAVERVVSLFPEVRALTVPAIVWGVCAVACWQAIAVIGLQLVRRAHGHRDDSIPYAWLRATAGCLLAFIVLVASAFTALNGMGYTPPGVMLALIAGGLIGLTALGSLVLLLGNEGSVRRADGTFIIGRHTGLDCNR